MPDGGARNPVVLWDFLADVTQMQRFADPAKTLMMKASERLVERANDNDVPILEVNEQESLVFGSREDLQYTAEQFEAELINDGPDAFFRAIREWERRKRNLDRMYVSAERHEWEYCRTTIVARVAAILGVQPITSYREWVFRKAFRKAIEAERRIKRVIPARERAVLAQGGIDDNAVNTLRNDYIRAAYTAALAKYPE